MRHNGELTIAMLIFAHNEASVIGDTVENGVQALGGDDQLIIIADNCTDDTVKIAKDAGAHVYTRATSPPSSKGQALAWFISSNQYVFQSVDFLLVLDADSRIAPNYLDIIREP